MEDDGLDELLALLDSDEDDSRDYHDEEHCLMIVVDDDVPKEEETERTNVPLNSNAVGKQEAKVEQRKLSAQARPPAKPVKPPKPEKSVPTSQQARRYDVEPYSGFTIRNRTVNVLDMQTRMQGKHFIPLDKIHLFSPDDSQAVVFIGILSSKTSTKQSKNNKNYATWILSDLKNSSIRLLVFGDVHATHWKTREGTVIGLLNPLPLDNDEQHATMFKVEQSSQLMSIGTCPDFGICKGVRRDGAACSQPINITQGNYCEFHVGAALKKKKKSNANAQSSARKPAAPRMSINSTFVPRMQNPQSMQGVQAKSTASRFGLSRGMMEKRTISSQALDQIKGNVDYEQVASLGHNSQFRRALASSDSSLGKRIKDEDVAHAKKYNRHSQLEHVDVPNTPAANALLNLGKKRTAADVTSISIGKPRTPREKEKQQQYLKAVAVFKKLNHAQETDLSSVLASRAGAAKSSSSSSRPSATPSPQSKPSLLKGMGVSLDLSSEEGQALLNKKSKYMELHQDVKRQEVLDSFEQDSEVEKLKDKMRSIASRKVQVFKCEQCMVMSKKKPELCFQKRHNVARVSATERFFRCGNCQNHRALIGEKVPTKKCKCGKANWIRASMLKEREVNAAAVKPLARGIENGQFINSWMSGPAVKD